MAGRLGASWGGRRQAAPGGRLGARGRGRLRGAAAGAGAGGDAWDAFCWRLQAELCAQAEALEGPGGGRFGEDPWERGGGQARGLTRVLQGGRVLEKAAVNVSVVRGRLTASRAAAMRERQGRPGVEEGAPYAAAAVSLVFHAANPYVPTLRGDVRRMALLEEGGEGEVRAEWFGGGADLTPSYLDESDCRSFHGFWADACARHGGDALYPDLKRRCDEYFYIPARGEHRGVGGIFFDDMEPGSPGAPVRDPEAFARDVGENLVASWEGIARRRAGAVFGERERHWQCLRRGRYIEFNLLYDRGVRFGLDGGRIESIMVSAPPLVAWDYRAPVGPGSPEAAIAEVLQNPRDWV